MLRWIDQAPCEDAFRFQVEGTCRNTISQACSFYNSGPIVVQIYTRSRRNPRTLARIRFFCSRELNVQLTDGFELDLQPLFFVSTVASFGSVDLNGLTVDSTQRQSLLEQCIIII